MLWVRLKSYYHREICEKWHSPLVSCLWAECAARISVSTCICIRQLRLISHQSGCLHSFRYMKCNAQWRWNIGREGAEGVYCFSSGSLLLFFDLSLHLWSRNNKSSFNLKSGCSMLSWKVRPFLKEILLTFSVITSPELHKHGDIWVVPSTDHVCTRFFFV